VLESLGVTIGEVRSQVARFTWWQSPQPSVLLGALVLGIGVPIGWAIAH